MRRRTEVCRAAAAAAAAAPPATAAAAAAAPPATAAASHWLQPAGASDWEAPSPAAAMADSDEEDFHFWGTPIEDEEETRAGQHRKVRRGASVAGDGSASMRRCWFEWVGKSEPGANTGVLPCSIHAGGAGCGRHARPAAAQAGATLRCSRGGLLRCSENAGGMA